jgi:hypothetical protein
LYSFFIRVSATSSLSLNYVASRFSRLAVRLPAGLKFDAVLKKPEVAVPDINFWFDVV